jgi:hypothetical protein
MRFPLPKALRLIERFNRYFGTRSWQSEESVIRYTRALSDINRWSLRNNCMVKSLTSFAFLNSPYSKLELVFGVEVGESGGIDTIGRRHLWVEKDGKPFHEAEPLENYRVVCRYRPGDINGRPGTFLPEKSYTEGIHEDTLCE